MRLIILGSGTGIPLKNRASPSLALYVEDNIILLDIGPGTMRQMAKAGIDHRNIRHILLTHFHPDHNADLVHLLFATRNPSILKNRRPFQIIGPTGLNHFLDSLKKAYNEWLTLSSEILSIQELDVECSSEKSYNGFKLKTCQAVHTPQSLAYRIETTTGKSLVYSGDTGFSEEIVQLAKGTDLLVLECSFPENQPVEGHLTPSLAGRMAQSSGARCLVLIHFYPECLLTDIVTPCRRAYKGELILGSDLLHIHI
jgi:ribonuclease BN (tRNA processing enzyme)